MILTTYISSSISGTIRKIKSYCFGKSDVRESFQSGPAGIDSCGIPGMKAIYAKTANSSTPIMVGWITKAAVLDGEIKIFSFDENGEQAYMFCDKEGYLELNGNADNAVGYQKLKNYCDDIQEKLNEVVDRWNSFASLYTPGSPSTTGQPATASQATNSNADFSLTKINNVKLP